MSYRLELLRSLADGRFHSGEALGRSLGISRAAVWKHLRALRDEGIEIHSVPGRGHRLASPVELLSAAEILGGLSPAARDRLGGLEIHHEIDSTSSELLRRAAGLPAVFACLAECQRAGRGRRNRAWVSPYARNLCLSLLWRFSEGPDTLGGLSLAVGVGVLRALEQLGVGALALKWPNDILWRDAKLAGTLIEMSGESRGPCAVVIGIGINVDMPPALGTMIDQAWTDVRRAAGRPVSRNRLAAAVLEQVLMVLERYQGSGLAPFVDEWRQRDCFAGRSVLVRTGRGEEYGVARGIDSGGALLLERDGAVRRVLAGDVSLRATAGSKA